MCLSEVRVLVVAAVIERKGRILACQRRSGTPFALQWEFPGGKVQPGESPERALERELREELGVRARIGPLLYRCVHHYAGLDEPVELAFFQATIAGRVRNLAFEKLGWFKPQELPALDFLAADRKFVRRLARTAPGRVRHARTRSGRHRGGKAR